MNMAVRSAEFALPALEGLQPRALLPLRHAARQPLRFDFPAAWRHFLAFKDDKEQTSVAFCIFEALPWRDVDLAAQQFLATPQGRAIYADEPFLPEILDDHPALRRLPKGTLAHAYCDFVEREGLSAAGLVAEFETMRGSKPRLNDKVEWYIDRLRDTHDLLHILTGYGRDALGEQCVLGFVFHQRPSWGHIFLAYAGAVVTRHRNGTRAPVLRAVREAQVLGRACPPLAEQSIRQLLAMPTESVQRKFVPRPPRLYGEVHRIWREAGIEPS